MADLNKWVKDQLHDIIGFTDRSVCDYVIALAKQKNHTSSSLLKALEQADVPNTTRTKEFAKNLLAKLPKAGQSAYKEAEKSTKAALKKNASYAMLDDDDEEEEMERMLRDNKTKMAKDLKRKAKEDAKAEKKQAKEDKKAKKQETEDERAQRERDDDMRERDEFHQRMVDKEKANTRKIGATKTGRNVVDGKDEEDVTEEELRNSTGKLREIARREYLKKRETQQLMMMEKTIEEEEFLFEGEQLTAAERRRNKTNKELLSLAKERINNVVDVEAYQMPDGYIQEDEDGKRKINRDKKHEALHKRYKEDKR